MIKKGFLFYNSKLSLTEYVKEKICFDKKNQTVNLVALQLFQRYDFSESKL